MSEWQKWKDQQGKYSKDLIFKDKTIFITIAACKEYYLIHTIKSALASAKYPERIYFGIFNTILNKDDSLIDKMEAEPYSILKSNNIFYTEFYSPSPMGTGFSRMNAQLLFDRDHDYVLQIDAHTIFDKFWDTKLINNYNLIKDNYDGKFVLSNMNQGFMSKLGEDRESLHIFAKDPIPIDNIYEYDSDLFNVHSYMPSVRTNGMGGNNEIDEKMVGVAWVEGGEWNDKQSEIDNIKFHEGHCVVASMVFYSFKDLMDILHYPKDIFFGDQINFSLRLVSRNFRIFHFYKPAFLSLGKYKPDVDPEYHWQSAGLNSKYMKYLDLVSPNHHKEIFSGEYFGYWGAPDKESLDKAKKIMGIEKYLEE